MSVCLPIYASVPGERCFIGSHSNDQSDQDMRLRDWIGMNERGRARSEKEGLKGFTLFLS